MIARVVAIAIAVFAAITPSLAVAQPVVRVFIRQKPPLLAGQEVRIDVQVLVPNFLMSSPRFPTLDIPGAVVTLADDSLNLNETIKNEAYAGIQRTYVLVAQAAGRYALPAAAITFRYAEEAGKPADGSVTLPTTTIDIEWPAGVTPPEPGGHILVARVTITQEFDRDPAAFHVGEALTRTVVTTIDRSRAMFIPPPSFTAPPGVRVYQKDPVLADEQRDRVGLVAGHRTDRVVYTFEQAGTFVLPAVEVPWFNAEANRQDVARTESISVTVASSSASAGIAPEAPPRVVAPPVTNTDRRRMAILVLLSVVFFAAMGWRYGRRPLLMLASTTKRGWAAVRRDRARHLPPLNPA